MSEDTPQELIQNQTEAPQPNRLFNPRTKILMVSLGFEGGIGIVALCLGWLLGYPATTTARLSLRACGYGLAASIPLLIYFFVSYCWPIGPLRSIRTFLDTIVRPFLAPMSNLELGLISLSAGLGEELLFRGFLQGALSQWVGPTTGWLASSVLFGLAHFITPAYAVVTMVIGLYLGWIWTLSGNLLAPIITHAFYDFIALLFFLRFSNASQKY